MEITKEISLKVVGAGKVGMSIIQAFAQSGFKVTGIDINKDNLKVGLEKVKENLSKLVSKGKFSEDEKNKILSRINLTTDFSQVKDADVVIEAVFEDMDTKKEVFKKLDNLVESEDALLLTNTSSLSVTEIASVTKRPDKVAGMHFFNPVPVMKLVEIVKGLLTSEETVEKIKKITKLMNKTPIVSTDSPGFIVNRILNVIAVEAAKIVEEGVGSIEDVDKGVKLGLGHPMGPFELFDYLNAIHLLEHVTDYMAKELGERFRLPIWVKNLVKAGKIGKATGGFYEFAKRRDK